MKREERCQNFRIISGHISRTERSVLFPNHQLQEQKPGLWFSAAVLPCLRRYSVCMIRLIRILIGRVGRQIVATNRRDSDAPLAISHERIVSLLANYDNISRRSILNFVSEFLHSWLQWHSVVSRLESNKYRHN